MASLIENALDIVPCDLLLVPTDDGSTARIISRCKPSIWIVAPCADATACQRLAFSYGVHPLDIAEQPADWQEFATHWLDERGVAVEQVMLIIDPSLGGPRASHRLELMHLGQ